MRSRYGLCLQYLKGPTLQVRLSGLMELGKTVHHLHVSYTHQHQQRQLFQMAHQKVRSRSLHGVCCLALGFWGGRKGLGQDPAGSFAKLVLLVSVHVVFLCLAAVY